MDAERIAEIRDTLGEWDALTEPGDPAHFCLAAKLLASLPGLIEAYDAATKRAEAAEREHAQLRKQLGAIGMQHAKEIAAIERDMRDECASLESEAYFRGCDEGSMAY